MTVPQATPVGTLEAPQVSARERSSGAPVRRLAPKEHGAYGQLGFPLLVAMLLGRATWAGTLLTAASLVAFFSHEPLVLLLGQRGKKALREDAARAKTKLIGSFGVSLILGTAAFYLGGIAVRYSVLVSAACVVIALGFVWRQKERSLLGELWVALTLPLAALPVAIANGAGISSACSLVSSFVLAYCAGIVGVRGIIAEFKHGARNAGFLGLGLLLLPLAALSWVSLSVGLSALMFWAVVVLARLLRPSPKSLKKLGWSLVLASAVQAAWLVLALR